MAQDISGYKSNISTTEVNETTHQIDGDFTTVGGNQIDLGVGASYLGDGASVSETNQNINDSRTMLGDNSRITTTAMDENTSSAIQSALAMVGHNSDNMMKLAAESDGRATTIEYASPSAGGSTNQKKWPFIGLAAALAGAVFLAIKSRS